MSKINFYLREKGGTNKKKSCKKFIQSFSILNGIKTNAVPTLLRFFMRFDFNRFSYKQQQQHNNFVYNQLQRLGTA